MIIGKHIIKITKENKVILANTETGGWIRISNEVYMILKEILEKVDLIDNLTEDVFESKEDYLFIKEVFDLLVQSNIICAKDYKLDFQKKIASVQLTNRCNLKCTHCCVDAKSENTENIDLTTDQLKNIFDKLIFWNPSNIMLSGGEPMIRKDFIELLEYLRQRYNGKIILSTNSLFINDENVKKLVKWCDKFEISIDGINEKTCSMVRGKGVFAKVCNNVELLKLKGADNINLSMVFSDKNQHLEEQFEKLNLKMGTKAVCRIFTPTGRGEVNKEMFSDKSKDDIYIPSAYLSKKYNKPFGICFCSAGKREIFIGYDGRLYPCPSYMSNNFVLGNVLSCNKIDDLLKKDEDDYFCEHISELHPENLPKCKTCEVKPFCWTCPGEVRNIKTVKAFNTRCELLKPVLMERVWENAIQF